MNEKYYRISYLSDKSGEIKCKVVEGERKKDSTLKYCAEHGIEVGKVEKLYPFSMNKHQHDFDFVSNVCYNKIYDIINGEIEGTSEDIEKLEATKERAEYFFCKGAGVVWLTGKELSEAKELAVYAQCVRDSRHR